MGNMMHFTLSIVVSLLFQVCICYTPRECSSKRDCGPNECCVVGRTRYSIPECKPNGRVGNTCLRGAESEDLTLYYPNGQRELEGVYTLFCPCDQNLVCKSNRCTV
ncbi:astakine isoform X2 [Parasteatoda tepidariorum]|uniref:astakine isoform X2 n=1 Tax=Parasteatoda tepidariorum TaxID=114398 RepID=UPI001C72135E|nr:astakine isoform X1 [Parasteatoda tepidariorum]